MEIKDINGKILLSIDSDTLRGADLSGANLRNANLPWTNLSYADLSGADLSGANLRGAGLRRADLSYADLSDAILSDTILSDAVLYSANLRGANLSEAILSSANLSGAKTDKRYIQISCIGSEKRRTTYCFDDNIVWCGCFVGSLGEFEEKVKRIHENNEQYLKEYLGFIEYIKTLKEDKE